MIKAIRTYMVSDLELVGLIGYTDKNRRIRPYEPIDKNDYPYIVFEVSPFLAGDVLTQYRLDIRFCSKEVGVIELIAKRLLYLFHHRKTGFSIEDTEFYSTRHTGGGGIIYYSQDKVFEQTLTFNIKSK